MDWDRSSTATVSGGSTIAPSSVWAIRRDARSTLAPRGDTESMLQLPQIADHADGSALHAQPLFLFVIGHAGLAWRSHRSGMECFAANESKRDTMPASPRAPVASASSHLSFDASKVAGFSGSGIAAGSQPNAANSRFRPSETARAISGSSDRRNTGTAMTPPIPRLERSWAQRGWSAPAPRRSWRAPGRRCG